MCPAVKMVLGFWVLDNLYPKEMLQVLINMTCFLQTIMEIDL